MLYRWNSLFDSCNIIHVWSEIFSLQILCGCGYLDGTEISEAISSTIHICQKDMVPHFYAPDVDICETVDHFTKQPDTDNPSRNGLVEAARLARSNIKPLCECEACMHGALVLPGGFGAAKTLLVFVFYLNIVRELISVKFSHWSFLLKLIMIWYI